MVFRARPGWWQFEETAIKPDASILALIETIADGLSVFSKTEIATGHYSLRRLAEYGVNRWEPMEDKLRLFRGQALFALALFLAQREDVSV